jgi:ABC-type transport system involved in multi-copper enzyme maturation permease subunit
VTLMVLVLARRETRKYVRSLTFRLFTTLACALSGSSAYVGVRDLHLRQQEASTLERERISETDRVRFGLQGREPELALRAIRSPEPLAILAHGAEHGLPTYWDFGPAGTIAGTVPVSLPASPVSVDLEFAVRGLLGLLVILLAVESLAGDRESGLQAAVLAQPLRFPMFLLGKVVGGAISALIALVLVVGSCWLGIVAADASVSSRQLLITIGLLGISGELYLIVMFNLGLLVASALRSRAAAATAGLAGWIVLAWATPAVSSFVADAFVPVQATQLIEHQKQVLYEASLRQSQETAGLHFQAIAGPRSSWDQALLLPAVTSRIEADWNEGALNRRAALDAIDEQAARARARRVLISGVFDFANPASQFARAAETLAGTFGDVTTAWFKSADNYQHVLNTKLFDNPPRLTLSVPEGSGRSLVNYNRATPLELADIAAFQPPTTTLGDRVRRSLKPVLVLFVSSLVFGGGASILAGRRAAVQS